MNVASVHTYLRQWGSRYARTHVTRDNTFTQTAWHNTLWNTRTYTRALLRHRQCHVLFCLIVSLLLILAEVKRYHPADDIMSFHISLGRLSRYSAHFWD